MHTFNRDGKYLGSFVRQAVVGQLNKISMACGIEQATIFAHNLWECMPEMIVQLCGPDTIRVNGWFLPPRRPRSIRFVGGPLSGTTISLTARPQDEFNMYRRQKHYKYVLECVKVPGGLRPVYVYHKRG